MTEILTLPRGIYGIHEQCPTSILPAGWILHLAEVGSGTDQHPGLMIPDDGRTPIVRIQHSWGVGGRCIPTEAELPGYLGRVATLVRNTPNCHIWIPGNEPNVKVDGAFLPSHVVRVYQEAWLVIRAQAGHEGDQVLLPPVGPWNVETGIAWITYFTMLTAQLDEVDGFALHTYSRGQDPSAVTSDDKMEPPYNGFYNGFRTYRDWMAAIPPRFRDRPVYITEANANDAWLDQNTGWVQAAYKEIDGWNRTLGNQQIRALILYRWPNYDKYYIEGKQGVIDDFLAAQRHGYTWQEEPMAMELQNPSFDGLWQEQDGISPLKVFVPWRVWWKQRLDTDPQGINFRPEAGPIADEGRYRSLPTAQKVWTNNATHTAGLYQGPITVPSGSTVTFRIHVKQATGTPAGDGYVKVGIDPTGGTDPWATRIVWSADLWMAYTNFVPIQVSATSQGQITVFTFAAWKWASPWCDTYWDDATMVVSGEPVPPPPPGPIFEDAEALYAYAVTLRTIAAGLDDVASRIGAGLPADARAKLTDAHRLLGEVLG